MNLYEVAEEIVRRLSRIFLKDEQGNRPVHGAHENSRRIPIGGITRYSMNTSTGTPVRASAPATRPDGPGRSRV